MNRSTRTLVVVGIAVVLAGLASFSVYRAIKNLPEKKVPIAERFTVVATQNIPVGILLTKELVKVVAWPASSPVLGGFASPDEVIGRGVTSMLAQNEPIVETKLAPRAAGGGLPPLITPGMRAMTVKVNDVIGVAGFTQQGTRVDVVVILRGGQEGMSRTVLSNVQVLSSNRRIDQEQARSGAGQDQSVVTLLVSPEDGEKLALATTQGSIVLALRNPLDTAVTETKGVRTSALMSGGEPPPAPRVSRPRTQAAPPPPPPPPGPKVVQAIRGSKVTQEVIKCCQ